MKITGIITEYNPFHNGHLYHLEKAKNLTKADGSQLSNILLREWYIPDR